MEIKKGGVPSASTAIDAGQPSKSNTPKMIDELATNLNQNAWQKHLMGIDLYPLDTLTMNELFDKTFLARPPIIDGLLYPGTYLFVGAPKLGKSFFMLQIAYHVATGLPLWDYPVRKGRVLYFALEDDERRLQERLYRMFGTEGTDYLHLATKASDLSEGLTYQLYRFQIDHPDTTLFIIDTLQKVRKQGEDKYSYANDYETIAQIKEFTDRTGVTVLLVHHTRKQQAEDKFEMISGTNGLMGAADGAFLLHKDKRVSSEAVLDISGRDQADQRIFLNRNEETLAWDISKVEAEIYEPKEEPIVTAVANWITEENPIWCGTASELLEILKVEIPVNEITKRLNVNATRLMNEHNIQYASGRNHDKRYLCFHKENKEA